MALHHAVKRLIFACCADAEMAQRLGDPVITRFSLMNSKRTYCSAGTTVYAFRIVSFYLYLSDLVRES